MSQTISNIESSHVVSNLDTYNYTVVTDGMYTVEVTLNEVPPSGLLAAINLNGTPQIGSREQSNVQASKIIQGLLYSANGAFTGDSGNTISLVYTDTASASLETVAVVGRQITVGIEAGVSTATQVLNVIQSDIDASSLVDVSTLSGQDSQLQFAMSSNSLTGGITAVSGPDDVPSATQSHINLRLTLNVEEDDVLGVTIASTEDSDTGPNAVKGIITIRQGSV